MTLEFWFEFASTYSYPAAMCIENAAATASVELQWRPFLLGPIFAEQGWEDSPFNLYPARGRYMWRDLERICTGQGIPLRRPSRFPRNGLLAARVACRFCEETWLPEFVRTVYRANFAEDREISHREVIQQCLTEIGVEGTAVLGRPRRPRAGSYFASKPARRWRRESSAHRPLSQEMSYSGVPTASKPPSNGAKAARKSSCG
jgi:2-hydroxychromene-2-carboxylate isomerase